jgi:hypothetical protein
MFQRCLSILGLCFISTLSFAAAQPSEATTEYHAAQKDMDQLQRIVTQLQSLAAQTDTDPAKGRATVDELKKVSDRMYAHLDNAIAGGHAVAMYQKAKLLFVKTPVKGNKTICDLYGHAAERGLVAGALEYAKCLDSYPLTEEYSRRMKILQVAVEGQDPYLSEYPLPTAFPYCFPKHKPALQPEEDPIQWIVDNARPQALSAEDFRAEGYYTLAMTGANEQTKALKAEFLKSAFAHGCREDSARIAKYLGVTVPPVSASALPSAD